MSGEKCPRPILSIGKTKTFLDLPFILFRVCSSFPSGYAVTLVVTVKPTYMYGSLTITCMYLMSWHDMRKCDNARLVDTFMNREPYDENRKH